MAQIFCRKSILFLWGILIAFSCTLVNIAHATEEEAETPQVPKVELKIEQLNNDLKDLSDALSGAIGDQKEALQLQLYQKNEELRSTLEAAIESGDVSKDKLIALVKMQQRYSRSATDYIEQQIKKLDETIDQSKDEERLALLSDYQELQHFHNVMIESKWKNILWLKELGVEVTDAERELKDTVTKRMRFIAASVEYYKQQISVVNKQSASRPESEKTALQLSQLVLKQRMEIATESLRALISIGGELDLDTSEYRRLMFEVTGSITQDLFDGKVIVSILSSWMDNFWDWLANNAPQHLIQLLVFVVILFVTKMLAKFTRKVIGKAVVSKNLNMSQLMQDFFVAMSGNLVWIIGFLVALSQIGLNLTPVLTGFGIAGVIIGFALQDTLSNFAAGMMLLIYRPFDVGDFVFAGGVDGKVSHMSLVNTTIKTFDNQIIIVPNSKIWGDVIKNVTHERVRRVDMVFGIGYGDDLLKAERVLTEIVSEHPSVLRAPEPMIKVHTLNTSSVDFIVRPWVKTDDYWDVYWDVTKEVKLRFDREGISIPFPQQDVHLHMVKEDSCLES